MPASTQNHLTSSFSAELADLGTARFDHSTAAIGDRDFALTSSSSAFASHNPLLSAQPGRAPKGLEGQVFAWNTFRYTTEDRNEKEEKKGDLHEGQLHRANRAAMGMTQGGMVDEGGGGGEGTGGRGGGTGGGRGGRGGRGGVGRGVGRGGGDGRGAGMGALDPLCAGRKPEGNVAPLAKGIAEELDRKLFWDGPVC